MQTEVKVRERASEVILSKLQDVQLTDIGRVISAGLGEAYGHLGRRRIRTSEAPFVIYRGMPGPEDLPFEIELCVPIPEVIEAPIGWECRTLEPGTFASVVHVGSYDTIGAAYDVLEDWISTHEMAPAGPPREVYLSEPATPPAETRTVVEFPIEPAKVATTA